MDDMLDATEKTLIVKEQLENMEMATAKEVINDFKQQ